MDKEKLNINPSSLTPKPSSAKRVSIVIPVYNSEKTLPKCLDSMIAQTYKDLEIICVNDCSKDSSLNIIKEYQKKDPRVKLIDHTENKNAGGARNSGIKAATGRYICFVDNDDWMTPDAIETLVTESEDCSIDFVAPDWCEWYSDDKIIEHSNLLPDVPATDNKNHVLRNGLRMLGCLINRDLFFDNDLFYPERTFWEDNAIGVPLVFAAKTIKAVKKVLYYYYISHGSSSRTFNLIKTKDRIKTTQMSYDNLKRLGAITPENNEMVNYHILCLSYWSIRMLARNAGKEAHKQLDIIKNTISGKIPNKYIKEQHPDFTFTLQHPTLTYNFLSLAFKVKKML